MGYSRKRGGEAERTNQNCYPYVFSNGGGSYNGGEREELMVFPSGAHCQVGARTAHFLKPIVTSLAGPVAAPSLSCPAAAADYKDLPLNVSYQGCKIPPENWKAWVDRMHALHHSTWKNIGIADAIMNSKCIIHCSSDLIFGFLEKWCATTNSFVFPWGEATVTLEDIMVLGGYPVLGAGVLTAATDEEMEEAVKKLQKSRSSISQTNARKACHSKWMAKFMESGSEIEHEAFLAYWLSRFVFPFTRNTISRNVVPIAVHLARGSKIALAPAVLSTIYKGLSLLKTAIVAARKSGNDNGSVVQVTVPALALVQVWIWERFPSLRPKPEPIGSKPGLARWHNLKSDSGYRSLMIDSTGKDFQWRPYNGIIYRDDEQWVKVGSDLDEDLMGFVRCLRTSELVGLDCIEQYLPHRVAMQFGMDQDLPGHVPRINVNPEIAWSDYTRPIRDAKIYVPSRLSQPQVTARYSKWWRKLNQGWSGKVGPWDDSKLRVKKEMSAEGDDDVLPPPPGFSPKRKRVEDAETPSDSWTRPRKSVESSSAAALENVPPKNSSTRTEKQAAQLSRNQLSSKANNENIEKKRLFVESKVKCEDRVDEEIVMSGSGKVQGSKSRALAKELDEKVGRIEKLVAALKAGVL